MRILVRHGPPYRRWHRRLGGRLEAAGHKVRFEAAGAPHGRRILALERRLYGVVADWDAVDTPPPTQAWAADVTIVLAGPPPTDGLLVEPHVAGGTGEAALYAAARAGAAPRIVVRGGPQGVLRALSSGRPAMEDARVLSRALEDLLPRLVTLLAQAVARLDRGESEPLCDSGEDVGGRQVSTAAHLARSLRWKLVRRLGAARSRPDHWRLALRREDEAADYALLAEDPSRFRADPFLFAEGGRLWLFYEEFPYATGRGVIGCFAVPAALPRSSASGVSERQGIATPTMPSVSDTPDEADAVLASGTSSPGGDARVVLEEPFHLSYPFVLRHAGQIYMLPETSAARCVRLYRADPFPDRWVPDAVLLEGCRLADATPVFHDDRWWLFAACDDDGGSSWDQLHLYHAPDLLGPWTPHAGNPVLIDAGAARPAGAMWHEDGVLMRPAQDCRIAYGAGVAVCRVERLDTENYRQSVVRRIEPPRSGATGLHTLNSAAGWEAVDLKTPHPR